MKRIQIGEKRYYTIDGRAYPSVTTILKALPNPRLELWELYTEDAEEIRDYRALIGTIAHYRFACKLAKQICAPLPSLELKKPELLDSNALEILNRISSEIDKWVELYKPRPLRVEHTVFNRELGYAGTLDLLALVLDKHAFLIDLKTSKAIYPEHHAQVAAYLKCLGIKMNAAILRVNEESSEFKILNNEEIEKGFELFKEAIKCFKSST